jgi:hypothetical protein
MTAINTTQAADVVAAVRISHVYEALTGEKPRRTGAGKYRARAVWRNGDGLNVSLDNSRNTWFDFRDGCGGGVLGLIVQVRGASRQKALRWLADFACMSIDHPLTRAEREQYRRQSATAEREATELVWWRDGLLEALRHARDAYLGTYHRGKRYIIHHGLDAPFGNLAADAGEYYLAAYQKLDRAITRIEEADWSFLLDYYRRTKRAEAS